jgi:hypothetical protein
VLLAEVRYLVRQSRFRCSTGGPLTEMQRGGLVSPDKFIFHLIAGPKMKLLGRLVIFIDDAAISSGELNGPSDYGAEHRLEIKRRADRLAYLPQGFQFPNRPSQLAGTCFQFLEETYILNRDHCLVGEGFEKLDLRRSERAYFHAACD